MTIAKDKMVSLTYELRLDGKGGDVFEKAGVDNPMVFLFGSGMMIPAFEDKLSGLTQGSSFDIEISAAEAYGEVNKEAIVELPRNIFEVEGEFNSELVKEGNTVPMMSSAGQRMNGIVLSVGEEAVKMDFNHPLAGEDLYFEGKVIEVRDATEEELAAAQNNSCGCSSTGCGDSGCNSSGCECDSECDSGCC